MEQIKGDGITEVNDGVIVSDYLSDAEKIKLKLDAVSPSLCLAKWMQTSLHLTTGMTNSCYHPPLHKISVDSIKVNPSKLHNTEEKCNQRKQMLAGQRPAGCSYCWTMEDQGNLSDRHYRSGEPWANEYFETIKNSSGDEDVVPS